MITRIASIVFFLAVGINKFWPFQYAGIVIGIAALVVALGLIFNK